MPPKKKKKPSNRAFQIFIFFMVFIVVVALGFIALLWWRNRQLEFVRYEEFGIALPARYSIHGIDVSRYQQRISWSSVKAMQVADVKISFAFIKATEGKGNVDPFFKRNWKAIKKAGLTRGAYHFFIASKSGELQAKNFIKNVTLESGDLPPVLDVEQTNGMSTEKIRKEVKAWLEMVQSHYSVNPIIYTNAAFYERYLEGYFDDYPLWVAHYLEAHQPRTGHEWTFWQYSEQGRVNGIRNKVDFNVFNGDSVRFQAFLVP